MIEIIFVGYMTTYIVTSPKDPIEIQVSVRPKEPFCCRIISCAI